MPTSKDHEGNVLISLPPLRRIPILVKPTEREMRIINQYQDEDKDMYLFPFLLLFV